MSTCAAATSTTLRMLAGIMLPAQSACLPAGAAARGPANILRGIEFPAIWPWSDTDFRRRDESSDTDFYSQPRFVTHIDDLAIASLGAHYARTLQSGWGVLDLCTSWISHLPPAGAPALGEVVGLGMNAEELEANDRLTGGRVVQDLNTDPALPFEEGRFDAVLNAVSVDYLTQPLEVAREMHRVLRPGGTVILSFSNRCFPTKASDEVVGVEWMCVCSVWCVVCSVQLRVQVFE